MAVAIEGQIYQDPFLERIAPDSEVYFLPRIGGGRGLRRDGRIHGGTNLFYRLFAVADNAVKHHEIVNLAGVDGKLYLDTIFREVCGIGFALAVQHVMGADQHERRR